MSRRAVFVRVAVIARPEIVAHAIRRVAWALDEADDERKITFHARLDDSGTDKEIAAAWSQVALILADEFDLDSMRIRAIANGISKGVQGELDC